MEPRETHSDAAPLVTVAVCTFNRAEMLEPAVRSLIELQADGFDYEVLVVDNASTDGTPEVIQQLAEASPRVRGTHESVQGVSAARNRALAEARGEWIAYFDDDQRAEPQWLQELLAAADRHQTPLVGGRVELRLPAECDRELPLEARQLLGAGGPADGDQPYHRKFTPGAGNLLVRCDVLQSVGGFDVGYSLGGEDTELFRRLSDSGVTGWYAHQAVVLHHIPAVRLADDYMRWSALREGAILAQMEREQGRLAFAGWIGIRAAQAVLKFWPRWVAAKLAGRPEAVLGANLLIWRIRGYLGKAWRTWWGRSESQSLQFREGREKLVGH